MSRTRSLARQALAVVFALTLQAGPVAGHDDGMTCHEHPTGGWDAGYSFHAAWPVPNWPAPFRAPTIRAGRSSDPLFVRAGGLIRVRVSGEGVAAVTGQGRVHLQNQDYDYAMITIDRNSTSMDCGDAGVTRFDLALQDRRSGVQASLAIIALEPIRERGRHQVRFRLEHPDGVAEQDGAILVVSAADGPMP